MEYFKEVASIVGRHGLAGQISGYLTFNTMNNGSLGERMRITHTGDVLVNGLLVHSSSQRWKTNIQPIEGALDKVQRLRGVSYNRKADGRHDIGVIAEEVGQVIPEVVTYEENGIDAQGVDYARLVAVLIEARKEQQREIEALKAAVKSLETGGNPPD